MAQCIEQPRSGLYEGVHSAEFASEQSRPHCTYAVNPQVPVHHKKNSNVKIQVWMSKHKCRCIKAGAYAVELPCTMEDLVSFKANESH